MSKLAVLLILFTVMPAFAERQDRPDWAVHFELEGVQGTIAVLDLRDGEKRMAHNPERAGRRYVPGSMFNGWRPGTGIRSCARRCAAKAMRPVAGRSNIDRCGLIAGTRSLSGRIEDSEILKVRPKKATVAGQQAVGPESGVCADEEIGDQTSASPAASEMILPDASGMHGNITGGFAKGDLQQIHLLNQRIGRTENRGEFRPHDFAGNQMPFLAALPYRISGDGSELLVRGKNVNEDVGVDGCNQGRSTGPRSSSMISSVLLSRFRIPKTRSTGSCTVDLVIRSRP